MKSVRMKLFGILALVLIFSSVLEIDGFDHDYYDDERLEGTTGTRTNIHPISYREDKMMGPRLTAHEMNNWKNDSRGVKKPKFFPLFTIVRFTNEACQSSTEEHGICYTRGQCSKLGGTVAGQCAQGLGVCCQFYVGCGGVILQNGTLFRNPDYPNRYKPVTGSDVCQIDGPVGPPPATGGGAQIGQNDAGTCKTDALTITSAGALVPSLCGNLVGQHLYVDFGTSDTITLNLLLSQNAQLSREWSIEILMVPCRSELRAPTGCLQYFQGVSGQVQSFNFQGGSHLANQDYTICVRMEDGMRSIEWSPCTPGDVRISGPVPVQMNQQLTPATAITICQNNYNDYLTIMGGIIFPLIQTTGLPPAVPMGGSVTDRFCDTHFGITSSSLIRSNVRPFNLHFHTDGGEIQGMNDNSAGFCLKWQQTPTN